MIKSRYIHFLVSSADYKMNLIFIYPIGICYFLIFSKKQKKDYKINLLFIFAIGICYFLIFSEHSTEETSPRSISQVNL